MFQTQFGHKNWNIWRLSSGSVNSNLSYSPGLEWDTVTEMHLMKKRKPSKIPFLKADKGAWCIIEEYVNKILMIFFKTKSYVLNCTDILFCFETGLIKGYGFCLVRWAIHPLDLLLRNGTIWSYKRIITISCLYLKKNNTLQS